MFFLPRRFDDDSIKAESFVVTLPIFLSQAWLPAYDGGEDAEDVHEAADHHHLGGAHARGRVDDGVGRGGHRQHEGKAARHCQPATTSYNKFGNLEI